MKGNFVSRGNQYIQLVKVMYSKLLTIGKQPPTSPHKVQGLNLYGMIYISETTCFQ